MTRKMTPRDRMAALHASQFEAGMIDRETYKRWMSEIDGGEATESEDQAA